MKSTAMLLMSLVGLFFAFNANAQGYNHGVLVQRQIQCASNGYNPAECVTGLDRTERIYMVTQLSKSACIEGSTYSFYGNRISVRNGCRAIFLARGITAYPQPNDQVLQMPVTRTVLCQSQSYNPATCFIPLRIVHSAYLSQQLSNSACIQGQSYSIYGNYINVSNGCRAVFTVTGIE